MSASDQPPPTVIVQPAESGSIVHAGGRVAESIVTSFTGAPILLLIVILNIVMICAAAYYLAQVEETRAASVEKIGTLLDKCIGDTVPIAAFNRVVGAMDDDPPYVGRYYDPDESPNHHNP